MGAVCCSETANAEADTHNLIPNNSCINPPGYTHYIDRCLCHGNYWRSEGAREHMVLLAFLKYDNDEFDQPTCGNGTLFPVNKLACILGGTDIIHVQMVFIDTFNDEYVTISTDFGRGVHLVSRKSFAKRGWRWVTIMCTEQQEVAMYNFCIEQVLARKGFSRSGVIGLYTMPIDNGGETWFCSELVLATLRAGGLTQSWPRFPHTVKPHELYEYIANSYTDTTTIVHDEDVNPALNAHERRTERRSRTRNK